MMENLGEGEKADAKLEEIKAAMAEQGFAFSRPVGSRSEGLTLVFDRKGVRTDIHFFYRNDETNEFYINILDGPTSYKNVYTQFEVRPAEAFGVLVAVPYPAQEYLATTYGDFMRKRTSERGTGEGTAGWNLESPLNANVTRRSLQSCDAYKAYGQKYFCICKFYGCMGSTSTSAEEYFYKCITDMYQKIEKDCDSSCRKDAYNKLLACYYDLIKNYYTKMQGCYNDYAKRDSSCMTACNASTAPENGGAGNCSGSLASGATCRPTCDTGYKLSGATTCWNGNATVATCLRNNCTRHM